MTPRFLRIRHAARALALLAATVFAGIAHAATADIANTPLANQTATAVKPNLMFILDDSGSMAEYYLPDEVVANQNKRCFGYWNYNKVFYNPNTNYVAPLDGTGKPMADATFTAAKIDGFSANGGVTDLSDLPNLPGPQTAANQVDGPFPTVILSTAAAAPTTAVSDAMVCGKITAKACAIAGTTTTTRDGKLITTVDVAYTRGDAPGQVCGNKNNSCTRTTTTTTTVTTITAESKFYYATLKADAPNDCNDVNYDVVTALPAEQRTNYANWYSYYSTRMLMMRSAAGRVFNDIDPARFRIGFTTISENGVADNAKFLNVGDFDANDQKATFFNKLYSTVPAGSTPLRVSLDKVGKYFADKVNGQAIDPMQYACQRNYTILSTDGYWNTAAEPQNYVPTQIDGTTAIGNQDAGNTPRPQLDDGQAVGGNWITGGGGVSNSLADIAAYFYNTDLRDPALGNCAGSVANQDVCANQIVAVGKDTATTQHMTTFTLGLGVSGMLQYQPDYETATAGDFFALRNGTVAWPNPLSDSSGGYADPSNTVTARIDDLWHAAVNGRGMYYSASNPLDLADSLTSALSQIQKAPGTGAAAATSSLKPTTGDNFIYLGQYITKEWSGNIQALTIDPGTGDVSATPRWQASETLKNQVAAVTDNRNIYFFRAGAGNRLATFTYDNLNAAGLGANFVNLCQNGNFKLTQCAGIQALGANSLAAANTGANVVSYLRGQTQFEQMVGNAAANRLFRNRPTTPLGDMIGAAPVYLKKAPFKYTDAGYATYVATTAARQAVVYAAANDGMLHAFNADNGIELWAYVPTMAMNGLYALADAAYDGNHRYYVDGTPTIGDVYDGSAWRTVLVGGLSGGGRGYYALDVTDPANPTALWEISADSATTYVDTDLGLTYGNPVIAKNAAGTWVVAFSSGYNNVNPGTGNGFLFVRNAITGEAIAKIATFTAGAVAAGTAANPSNLGKIEGWVDTVTDNTATRFYGADMRGNVWRFDYDDLIAPAGVESTLLGQARAPGGQVQPITIKPELAVAGNGGADVPVVIVATGRFLGTTDLADQTVQSIYVFKDVLAATGLGVLRQDLGMHDQTLASATDNNNAATRRIANPALIDWNADDGWFVDLDLSAGERVNVDMVQTGDLLLVASNVPAATACTTGGTSWFYSFSVGTGTVIAAYESQAMTAGLNLYVVGNTLRVMQFDVTSHGTPRDPGALNPTGAGAVRRSSWRELVD